MFHFILKVSILALLLWVEAVAGQALALGPADGGELTPTDLERVKVGSPAPDFALADEDSVSVTLAQFRGQKNVVLVFYRGHW